MVMTSMLENVCSAKTAFEPKQMPRLDSFGLVRSVSNEVKGDRRLTAWFVLGHKKSVIFHVSQKSFRENI